MTSDPLSELFPARSSSAPAHPTDAVDGPTQLRDIVAGAEELADVDRRYRRLFEQMPVAVYIADADEPHTLRYVSPQIETLLGYARREWIDRPGLWLERRHPEDRDDDAPDLGLGLDLPARRTYRMLARDGRVICLRDESTVLELGDGPRYRQGVLVEVEGEGERPEPYLDRTTGLPAPALLRQHLALALARAEEDNREVALLAVGLDEFRLVNESLGRAAGDVALGLVADRLRDLSAPTSLVARLGGDQFAILLADLPRGAEQRAETLAGQVNAALEDVLHVDGSEFQVGASTGASVFPHDARDEDSLLQHAEAAMREAKSLGRGGFAVYAGGTSEALERLMMPLRLRRALEQDGFVLHYQPIYALDSGRVVGVEALIRCVDEQRGLIAPVVFIPVAEETGQIDQIGAWVVEAICAQARAWRGEGLDVPIAFNVSLRQFQRAGFAARVRDQLGGSGLDPSGFIVEITESTAMREPHCVEPVLHELREAGMRIAIDDFGTGYSSLSRLQHMPVSLLKIDRTFLRDAPGNPEAARLVTATVDLVAALGMSAVAEGVETEEQRRFLIERGCPLAQGFHLAHPVSAEETTLLLRAERDTQGSGPTSRSTSGVPASATS